MLPAVYPGYDYQLFTLQSESNKNLSLWHQQYTSGPSLRPSAGYPRNRKNHALVILALAVHPGPTLWPSLVYHETESTKNLSPS